MRHYCTLFDRNYLPRGLALHRSLLRHGGEFRLHVLCLDEATTETLGSLRLERVDLIPIAALEARDRELKAVRPVRKPAEFYFTCKPVLLACLLERHPDAERITYLDSDLYFFSSAAAAEAELRANPVALSPHAFGPKSAFRIRYGRFNAGWVSIDTSEEARRFVTWWRERCIEWCQLVVEDERFGDQKYLDRVPELFPGTALAHRGVNAGPWSLDPDSVEVARDQVTLGGKPLVVFHFHNVRRMAFGLFDSDLHEYGLRLTPSIRNGIYRPYVDELARCGQVPAPPGGFVKQMARTARAIVRGTALRASS